MRIILLVAATIAASAASHAQAPNFYARRDYSGLAASQVAARDLNGDGFPDLITVGGYINVLLSRGDGTFSPPLKTPTEMLSPFFFALGDLTGYGRADLVIAGGMNGTQPPNGIGVKVGNGDGTFRPLVFYAAGTDTKTDNVVLGDFNRDGRMDAIVPGSSGLWFFAGNGDGTFKAGMLVTSLGCGGGLITTADFNKDGKLDLVVSLPPLGGAGFDVLLGNGDGTFRTPQNFAHPVQPSSITTGDLNGDGFPDIVVSSASPYVSVYLGNGKGGFTGPTSMHLLGASGVAIGDVNGDGKPDLVSAGGYIMFGNGDGAFANGVSYPVQTSGGTYNVVLADLRKLNRLDIVTDSVTAVSVLLNQGKAKFEDGKWAPVAGGAGCGVAADFNRDGKPDLAVNNNLGISVLLGTGNTSAPFTVGPALPLANAGCLVSGDLNGDGIPDLIAPTGETVAAFLGDGAGGFSQASSTSIPGGGFLAVGDFNHDGKLDFATSGNLLGLGNGDGTFQTPVPFVPTLPQGGFDYIGAADLNGDGWPDIVLTNSFENYLYVLVNNHKGSFTEKSIPEQLFGPPWSAAQMTFGDVNGDGYEDMVVSGGGVGAISVYLADGTGHLTLTQTVDELSDFSDGAPSGSQT